MKIRNLVVIGLLTLVFGLSSCREDFDFDIASSELMFSKDTLNLDTVFNHTSSQTYQLTIHNKQNKDIRIPKIYLSQGASSLFKINVDGMSGFEFEDVAIRKKDSIFIFVEITAGELAMNMDYEDEINFETDFGYQRIKLLSHLERAKFYNTEMNDHYTLTETSWDSDYSRVIFGNVSATDLTIGPKTKVYLHNDANLNINGTININGSLGNEVIFRTDRMDERSDSLPNNWGKIKIKSPNSSVLNSINYAVIRGGNVGLEVESSKLEIKNTKIVNNEFVGLYGINAQIKGENLVVNNSNVASVAIEGGSVEFIHSTFANYHNIGQGAGGNYSLFLSNQGENGVSIPLTQANFYNCILYGRAWNAVYFEQGSGAFNHHFKNNVIRLDMPNLVSGIDGSNITDQDPMFVDPGFGKNDVRLLSDTEVAGTGSTVYSALVPLDILGQSRVAQPTPGAYQALVE